jgi:hypothetical protein
MWFATSEAHAAYIPTTTKEAGMYLRPDTTAILVADRRSALAAAAQRRHDATASRRRSLLEPLAHRLRRTTPTAAPDAAQLPASTGRTPVEVPARAA